MTIGSVMMASALDGEGVAFFRPAPGRFPPRGIFDSLITPEWGIKRESDRWLIRWEAGEDVELVKTANLEDGAKGDALPVVQAAVFQSKASGERGAGFILSGQEAELAPRFYGADDGAKHGKAPTFPIAVGGFIRRVGGTAWKTPTAGLVDGPLAVNDRF